MATNATKAPAKASAQSAKSTGSKSAASAAAPSTANSVSGDDAAKAVEKKLETKTNAVNVNNIARVANSQLTSNEAKLHPLLSLKNGKPIEKFPGTSKDIEKISLTVVDATLNALEADRSGNEAAKRERLRVQIGLKANPA